LAGIAALGNDKRQQHIEKLILQDLKNGKRPSHVLHDVID
jgi:hypothetical protein